MSLPTFKGSAEVPVCEISACGIPACAVPVCMVPACAVPARKVPACESEELSKFSRLDQSMTTTPCKTLSTYGPTNLRNTSTRCQDTLPKTSPLRFYILDKTSSYPSLRQSNTATSSTEHKGGHSHAKNSSRPSRRTNPRVAHLHIKT